MNIGSLIRGLLGEQKPGDAKTLELKPGQVVRGVVMNVTENGQEAVVQIQGVQVKAKLETPLRAGETALLQVQPPGESATAVLKPLSQSQALPLSPSSMAEVLEYAGLPDTKENREMIRAMQLAGVPLTRENISQFQGMMGARPPQVPAAEWLESAAIAFHRGLPITPESVRGLHQAVFGPPLHQLLQSLEQQLIAALTGQSSPGSPGEAAGASRTAQAAPGPGAAADAAPQPQGAAAGQAGAAQAAGGGQQAVLVKLQGLLHQLRTELAQQPWNGQQLAQGSAAAAQGQAAGLPAGPAAAGAPPAAAAPQGGEGAAGPSPQQPPVRGSDEPWVGRLLKLLGAEHEQQALRGAAGSSPAGDAARAAGSAAQPGQHAQALPGGGPAAGGSAQGAAGAAGAGAANAPAPAAAGQAAASVAAAGGQAAQPAAVAAGQAPSQPGGSAAPGAGAAAAVPQAAQAGAAQGTPNLPGAVAPQAGSVAAQQDTIKGLLLQLVSANDTPPALKEAAQQLVQHLTGQQLLLNTDRTAPFAQVTMFIPLHGADGQQTASIHIQSRRGPKGELDSTNCRLLFDLDMKALGLTLIDVQIVDRIVSVNIRNDQEWASELFEQRREDLATGVESVGYQLLSLKVEPLPEAQDMASELPSRGTASEYTPQSYKGVDMRI